MSLLEVEALSVGFRRYDGLLTRRETPALRAINLAVDRGEVLAVVGASGAGKSLLAHALLGILPHNAVLAGRIRFDGQPFDAGALCGRRIALVPQGTQHLDPLVPARRQVVWAARRSRACAEPRAAAAAALARFGLAAGGEKHPHQLSGGMARRVMLAIATVGDPDLVVADEPTNGLDAAVAATVLAHLRALADAGKAVLLVTHDLSLALPYADRVALIDGGTSLGLERAADFSGRGERLSAHAQSMWLALPENDFCGAVRARG